MMNAPKIYTLWQWRDYEHNSFSVEVSHTSFVDTIENKVINVWMIYVYILPKHPWFNFIREDKENYPFFDIDRSVTIKKTNMTKTETSLVKFLVQITIICMMIAIALLIKIIAVRYFLTRRDCGMRILRPWRLRTTK